jgi:hypothetical protein
VGGLEAVHVKKHFTGAKIDGFTLARITTVLICEFPTLGYTAAGDSAGNYIKRVGSRLP